jgi:hypothetical protein
MKSLLPWFKENAETVELVCTTAFAASFLVWPLPAAELLLPVIFSSLVSIWMAFRMWKWDIADIKTVSKPFREIAITLGIIWIFMWVLTSAELIRMAPFFEEAHDVIVENSALAYKALYGAQFLIIFFLEMTLLGTLISIMKRRRPH